MIFLYNFKYSIFEGNRFTGVARAANKRRLQSEIDANTDIATSANREMPAILANQIHLSIKKPKCRHFDVFRCHV